MKLNRPILILAVAAFGAAKTFAAPMGSAFTYQGRLNDGGAPANGNYDMIFNLYDDPTNGNVIGSFSIFGAVPVTNGLFTVELNSYGEFGTNAFNGQARWLQIGVRTNNNSLANPWINLSPRQALNCAPQAMFAQNAASADTANVAASVPDGAITGAKLANGAVQANNLAAGAISWSAITGIPAGFADGVDDNASYSAGPGLTLSGSNNQFAVVFGGSGSQNAAARSDHQHFGAGWSGNASFGSGLSVTNASANSAAGVFGQQGTGSGFPYVFGNTAGVWGESSQGSGVYGATAYTNGSGVVGLGAATNGSNHGVYGVSLSKSGAGVFGSATATSGNTAGVSGQSSSSAGVGVRGLASSTTGATAGVRGESASGEGSGVTGLASALWGAATGVFGQSDAPFGTGVFGRATFVSGLGANYGVIGQSDSLWGYGVYGHAASPNGINFGVVGEAHSTAGYGVVARNSNGVALKVEGTGIIQSDADSYILIPATSGFGKYHDTGVERHPGYFMIHDFGWGDNVAVFPLPLPGVLYGQKVILKGIEIIYDLTDCCGENQHSWISHTKLVESAMPGRPEVTLIDDPTEHRGADFGSYTYALNHPLGDTAGCLTLEIQHAYVVQYEGDSWVNVYGIKLHLGHK